ncbi:BQ2448_2544 [Microbotryum intermedium]|uniref:BQ2448_2544 protein n=1 Tax=Microbotryum intermedium TaxID=269621 RepID=A0A238FCC0_9BASI|nr:BQ2448_2544 [Microbotryum intermedium]
MPRPLPGHMALKDFRTRKQVAANELLRRAYLYLYRNTTVDPKIRTQAMLKLNAFTKDVRSMQAALRTRVTLISTLLTCTPYIFVHPRLPLFPALRRNPFKKTRPTSVKNRCTETGRGGGVLSEFGLCRHRFKLAAEKGDIPGVSRAAW